MPNLDATVYPDEAYVLVQVDWANTFFRDTFTRVSASGWTPADTGQAYTIQSGAAANFTINGTQGVITHAATSTDRLITAGISQVDVDFSGIFINTATPAGADFEIKFPVRYVDGVNFVDARLLLTPGGTVIATLRQRIAGVDTSGGSVVVAGLTPVGVFGWRFVAQGSSLMFRVWDYTTVEPATWNITMTTTMLSAGAVGVGSWIDPGVTTPTPIVFLHDNLVATDPNAICPDYATVTRRNTVTGEIVTLRPYVAFDGDGNLLLDCCQGLWWDTEPPLNVPLEYCAVSSAVDTDLAQNPGFETTTAPWTGTGFTLTQDATAAKVGSFSLRATSVGSVDNPRVEQTGITGILAGETVTFSAWIKTSGTSWNGVRLEVDVIYASLAPATYVSPIIAVESTTWRFVEASFVATDDISSATLALEAMGTPTVGVNFQVDEFRMTHETTLSTTDCETVTVESESVWLKNPLHPCLDVEVGLCNPMLEDCEAGDRVTYVGMEPDEYAANTALLNPANRRRPIPINRIRRDAASTLRVLAHTCAARDAVLDINEPGDPLLFQAPEDYCIPDRYISVGTLTDVRISVDQREDFRLMVMPYVVVDRPIGPADGVCGARIMDLCDIYASWSALGIAGFTWTDLLLGLASPNGPGQDDPPVGARTWADVEAEFADWAAVEDGGSRDWGELRDGL